MAILTINGSIKIIPILFTNRSRTLLPTVRNSTSPSIPCTPWDTEHRHPHQRKVTPTTRKYMATIHHAYTPYHHTQASYHIPYIFSYPTERTRSSTPRSTHTTTNRPRPSRSSKKQPTSPHRRLTILLLNCKTNYVMVFEISTSHYICIL
jgi:hypothetical protein